MLSGLKIAMMMMRADMRMLVLLSALILHTPSSLIIINIMYGIKKVTNNTYYHLQILLTLSIIESNIVLDLNDAK